MNQSVFKFDPTADYSAEKFLISESNRDAYEYATNFPWESYALSIYGAYGSGKTHLANIIKSKFAVKVIEDINSKTNQKNLLHSLNLARENNEYVLLTSEHSLTSLSFTLADLSSRLSAIISIPINAPDIQLFRHLFAKNFSDLQLKVSDEIINYLAARVERNFYAPKEIIAKIDQLSLAQKRNVTIPLIKEILG